MKPAFITILLLLFNTAFCQFGTIRLVISNSDTNSVKDLLLVELTLAGESISEDHGLFNTAFEYNRLVPGMYKVSIQQIGKRPVYYDSLWVQDGQTRKLAVDYPGPCRFKYPEGYKPKCPFGHTDNIVPIVYGLPYKRTMRKSKKGKVHLGGCIISDCDPRFYCRLHQIEI